MGNTTAKHIVIVEDDSVLGGMLKRSLEAVGFVVSLAEDGEQGKSLAEQTPPPDFLIVDIDLPKIDGMTMLKMLRKKGVHTPAFVLTNLNRSEFIADAAEAGVMEYLVKSDWGIDEIVGKIQSHLSSHQGA